MRGTGRLCPCRSGWSGTSGWLATLDSEQHQRAIDRRDTFARFRARDPGIWAPSEVGQDFAQLARFLALRHIWPEHIDSWRSAGEPTAPYPEIEFIKNNLEVAAVIIVANSVIPVAVEFWRHRKESALSADEAAVSLVDE
jgi:hypothetical protein